MAEIIKLDNLSEATRRYVVMKFEGKLPLRPLLKKIADVNEEDLSEEQLDELEEGLSAGFPADITGELIKDIETKGMLPDWIEDDKSDIRVIMTDMTVITE